MLDVEKKIIRRVIRECRRVGFVTVNVWDGGEHVTAMTEHDVLAAVDAVCDSTIHFAPVRDLNAWGHLGVYVVLGNGIDVVSDYHCGDEDFSAALDKVNAYVNTLEVRT